MRFNIKRHGDIEAGDAALILVLIILVGGAAMYFGFLKLSTTNTSPNGGSSGGGQCASGYTATTGYQCTTLPIVVSLQDPYAGGGISGATITLYSQTANGAAQGETLPSSDSSGKSTSALSYTTGATYWAKITASGYVPVYEKFTVPPMPAGQVGLTTNSVPMYDFKTGAYTFSAVLTGGTVFSSGQNYLFSSTGLTQVTVSMTLSENTNNYGWWSTYDVVNKVNQNLVVQMDDGGTGSLSITGYQYTSKVGTTTYYLWQMPDGVVSQTDATSRLMPFTVNPSATTSINGATVTGSATLYLSGATSIGGSITYSFQVNKGSLATGSSETLTNKLYDQYDPAHFLQLGNGGPNAATLGSAFTLVFKG